MCVTAMPVSAYVALAFVFGFIQIKLMMMMIAERTEQQLGEPLAAYNVSAIARYASKQLTINIIIRTGLSIMTIVCISTSYKYQ